MRTVGDQSAKTSGWRAFIRSPFFLVANIALFFVIGSSTIRETYRGWSVDHEIQTLAAQADALEGRKMQLGVLTQDLSSPERVEFEARARLGRKKPNERVIILEGTTVDPSWKGDAAPGVDNGTSEQQAFQSNPEKWWRYFFH